MTTTCYQTSFFILEYLLVLKFQLYFIQKKYLNGSKNCKINGRRTWTFSGQGNALEKYYSNLVYFGGLYSYLNFQVNMLIYKTGKRFLETIIRIHFLLFSLYQAKTFL